MRNQFVIQTAKGAFRLDLSSDEPRIIPLEPPSDPRGFPPLPEHVRPLPKQPPFGSKISEWASYSLVIECTCGKGTSRQPLRYLSKRFGWDTQMGTLLARLRCGKCGKPPSSVEMTDQPDRYKVSGVGKAPVSILRLI